MRDITIRPALNGWICNVGCSQVVFVTLDTLVYEIKKYISNPVEVEQEYIKNAVNKPLGPVELVEPSEAFISSARQTAQLRQPTIQDSGSHA
jgi:hypothetical protein